MKTYTVFYEVSVNGEPKRDKYTVFAERIDNAISKARGLIQLKYNVKTVWIYDCQEKSPQNDDTIKSSKGIH